jgi:proline iminopeptidase
MKKIVCSIFLLVSAYFVWAQGEERLLNVNGTEINVRIVGSGSPILIVHGGPGLNHTYFLPHFTTLAKRHKLIFIDQRACGKSSGHLDSTQMNLRLFVEDMEAVRKELKLGKVSVVAHSWGGLLGILYASRYPEHISSLVLSNSVSPKSGEYDQQASETTKSRYSRVDSLLQAEILTSEEFKSGHINAYQLLFKIVFKQSFKNQLYSDSLNLTLPPDFMQKRNVLFLMSKELFSYDFYPELKKVKCPTLIIHGDYDAIPLALAQQIKRSIQHSVLLVIKDVGHFPFIEQKSIFFNAVENQIANLKMK